MKHEVKSFWWILLGYCIKCQIPKTFSLCHPQPSMPFSMWLVYHFHANIEAKGCRGVLLGFFSLFYTSAKLVRAHPPKYRPVTSVQTVVRHCQMGFMPSLTRLDAYRQCDSWHCVHTQVAQPTRLVCSCQGNIAICTGSWQKDASTSGDHLKWAG